MTVKSIAFVTDNVKIYMSFTLGDSYSCFIVVKVLAIATKSLALQMLPEHSLLLIWKKILKKKCFSTNEKIE